MDRGVFDRGHGDERAIRGATIDGVVDTGAVTLVLPQNVVERLGWSNRERRSSLTRTSGGMSGRWPGP